MRVKLASQILSHSVAAGINTYVALGGLPGAAISTAEFLEKMNKIFDSCNSISLKDPKLQRRPFTQNSPHYEIMRDGVEFFSVNKSS